MAFSYSGHCYADGLSVLTAFQQSFPRTEGHLVLSLVTSSQSGSPPLIAYEIRAHDLVANTIATREDTVLTSSCPGGFNSGFADSFSVIALLCILWALGFAVGFRR